MNKMENKFDSSEMLVDEKEKLPLNRELSGLNVIDWLQDEVDVNDFHSDEEFLDFIKNAGFDRIYYNTVYPHE